MKKLLTLLFIPLLAFAAPTQPITNGVVPSGGTLTVQSGGSIVASAGSTVTGFGSGTVLVPTAVKTTNYTAVVNDFIPVDTTSGTVTITLPTAPADKAQIGIKQVIRGGTNVVTIAAGGSDVFNRAGGPTTATLTLSSQSLIAQYKASGAIWYLITGDTPYGSLIANANTWSGAQTFTVPVAIASGGTNGSTLTAQIRFDVNGGGATLPTGVVTACWVAPHAGTITGYTILGDGSTTGSIVFDLWEDSYANFPPTVADTITASAKPTVTSALKAQSTTLTGWTLPFAKGAIIRANVDSVTSWPFATLVLDVTFNSLN